MEPTPNPADQLFIDKVLRARKIPPERKLMAPARLFEYARNITLAGIRHQHPSASEEQVRELFRQRMKLARQMENRA
jgi:hypothetical protein